MAIKAQTLKGFRDFLPAEANARGFVIGKIVEVFRRFGFEPLETPALEYEEVLNGKYGEEGDKLMYRFEDNGGRKVALRYDQTVPLARVVAQYPELPKPFKRYQIQPVWRAENTQKGRYREFLQCDADIVGSSSPLADAEIIVLAARALENLGVEDYKILINDRNIWYGIKIQKPIPSDKILPVVIALDKLKKIGPEGVVKEIQSAGFSEEEAKDILEKTEIAEETDYLKSVLENVYRLGLDKSKIEFEPVLARGLNYYTSTIFEIEIEGYTVGSVGGGGRYDNLIGLYSGNEQPAVGFAFGFDRLMEAMEQLNLLPANTTSAQVLVTIFSPELLDKSLEVSSRLRSNNINTELYLDPNAKLDKQLKYADQKGIPYVVIIGPDEAAKDLVTLKNLNEKTQDTLSPEELLKKF